MFEKIKRYIHRIKRHKRNKKLSEFADKLFTIRYFYCNDYDIYVHPLVYSIIRFRYPVSINYLRLKEDSFLVKDYFNVITVQPKGELYV
jgi:hypothetical protein